MVNDARRDWRGIELIPSSSMASLVSLWFLARPMACRILVPWPGIENFPPALGARSLIHWTTRDVSPWFSWVYGRALWSRASHLTSQCLSCSIHKRVEILLSTHINHKSVTRALFPVFSSVRAPGSPRACIWSGCLDSARLNTNLLYLNTIPMC